MATTCPRGRRRADDPGAFDPRLDPDLETWHAGECDLPRLTVLGPVHARTHGQALPKRKAYYTELLAYLALNPRGVMPEQVADAFDITPARVRNDIAVAREWLGTNPRTGERHLPYAHQTTAAVARGVPVYQVSGVLVDAELFRRLCRRARAHAPRLGDLQEALALVTGPPLTGLRPGGWNWLYQGDRLDHQLTRQIVDVAHRVAMQALEDGDLRAARSAARIALEAAPDEQLPRLDWAAVAAHLDAKAKTEVPTNASVGRREIGLAAVAAG